MADEEAAAGVAVATVWRAPPTELEALIAAE